MESQESLFKKAVLNDGAHPSWLGTGPDCLGDDAARLTYFEWQAPI